MLKKLYALKNKKGFTLVELMVVVAILGILVAVAVPVYNNVTGDAKINACNTNVKTIESAVQTAIAGGKAHISTKDSFVYAGPDTDTTKYTVAQLKEDGYLTSEPSCPFDTKAAKPAYVIGKNGAVTPHEHQ